MLLAFVEELGHQYEELLEGATNSSRGDGDLLIDVAAKGVKFRPYRQERREPWELIGSSEEEPESEDSDEEMSS